MRILLVCAALADRPRGNRTTVERWAALSDGISIVPALPEDAASIEGSFDLVHGYHALHGGVAAMEEARRRSLPLVVSLGGTDLFAWRLRIERWKQVGEVLEAADVVTGAFDDFAIGLPEGVVFHTVPRAITMEGFPAPMVSEGRGRVLLPAGIRPVKGVLEALDLAEHLHRLALLEEFVLAGQSYDAAYGAEVEARLEQLPFARLVLLDAAAMMAAYRRADVIWNTSRHEGGSNAILEAWAAGRPVFARDVAGNRELVERAPGEIALLAGMDDLGAIEAFHRGLAGETAADRIARMDRAVHWVGRMHAPESEERALLAAWAAAVARRG